VPLHRHFGPHDHVIALADGRQLGYAELGDPAGTPVVAHHGGLSSRLDVVPADAAARALGIRLLAPDRPGIGLSTRRPGRTLLDWPDDVRQLADQLDLDRFALLGWSLGGEFATAVAHELPARVSRLALVASTVPREWPDMEPEANPMDRMFVRFSRHGAAVDRVAFRLLGEVADRWPALVVRLSGLTPGSAAATWIPRAVAEGVHDTSAVVDEYRIFERPWGFDPARIELPTHVWQGDADTLVPVSWSDALAKSIPGAELTVVAGATHFLWYDRWPDILSDLAPPGDLADRS
jgi:pimeloyl-ACP methyl ester carboxylesterase